MKFAWVITNLRGGGAEKAVAKVGEGLARRGHVVHLILLEHLLEHVPPVGVVLSALTGPGQPLAKGWLGVRWAAWRLRRLVHRLEQGVPFDLVVSTLPFADEVAVRAGLARHWCRIANTLSVEVQRLARTQPAKARRRLARYRHLYGARPLIAVSDGVAEDVRGGLGLGDRHPVRRIYNPFDFEAIRVLARQSAPGRPVGRYVIHVGRFTPQKRHDLLLAAWGRLDIPHVLVLLTAPHPELAAMIAAAGLAGRVVVAGFQANPYPWMAGADLLVLCSDHEGMPNVLVEALICGTPVVATDVPSGPAEILGRTLPQALVVHDDAVALAGAMAHMLANPPDCAQLDLSAFAAEAALTAYEQLAASQNQNNNL
ncbi:MAG: glycosyltransferase [Magnetococcus sp. DMHC-8]